MIHMTPAQARAPAAAGCAPTGDVYHQAGAAEKFGPEVGDTGQGTTWAIECELKNFDGRTDKGGMTRVFGREDCGGRAGIWKFGAIVGRLLVGAGVFASLSVGGELECAQDSGKAAAHETRIDGMVRSASGEAVAGATVWLERGVEATALEESTSAEGKYVFVLPKGGSFRLKVMKDGYRATGVDSLPIADGESKHLDVELQKTDAATDAKTKAGAQTMELTDAPNYTVAGVTDWSNVGLHGSDATVRTSEKMAKETAALKPGAPAVKPAVASAADALRVAGDAKEKSGDPVGAVKEYEKAVKLDPSEENYFAWGAELLVHRGGAAAVEVFKKGAELHGKSARIEAGLGAAYYADGQDEEAAERICKAADLNPNDAAAYEFLGRMELASTELLTCSDSRLERFAKQQPSNALANYYYGVMLWKKGRREQNAEEMHSAEAHLKKAIECDGTLGEAYVQLGILYNAQGNWPAALEAFQKAVAAQPKLGTGHYNLSLEYRRLGEMEKAEQEMSVYDQVHKSDEAAIEKERRELRQFVTVLKDGQK